MRLSAVVGGPVIARLLTALLGASLFVLIAVAPVLAQRADDLIAIQKRYGEFFDSGNYSAALVEAERLEAGVRGRFGVNHANYGAALDNLARVYEKQGKYADAEDLLKRALAIKEKALGAGHRDMALTL